VGEAVKNCFASVSSGIRAMCPNRDRHLDWTMAERWGCLVNLLTSSYASCKYSSMLTASYYFLIDCLAELVASWLTNCAFLEWPTNGRVCAVAVNW